LLQEPISLVVQVSTIASLHAGQCEQIIIFNLRRSDRLYVVNDVGAAMKIVETSVLYSPVRRIAINLKFVSTFRNL
jgi:hypothetical protein